MPTSRLGLYKPGDQVLCRVRKPTKDGYTANVDNDVDAFLHTQSFLKSGDEVSATVVAISNRLLLTDRPEKFMPDIRLSSSKFALAADDQFEPGQIVSCSIKFIDTQGDPFMVVIQDRLFGCHLTLGSSCEIGQTVLVKVIDCKKGFLILEPLAVD